MHYQYYKAIKDYNFAAHEVLVFGCHELGKHYSGYAQVAFHHFQAKMGQGEGRQGQAYGIPTIAADGQVLSLPEIQAAVERFKYYAQQHPELHFYMTEIGCGFAGYNVADIAPMFKDTPQNIYFPESFILYLEVLPLLSVEDIESVWKFGEQDCIELPVGWGNSVRIALKPNEQLRDQANLWERCDVLMANPQYYQLDAQQFIQLHQQIEEFRQQEAVFLGSGD